MYIKTVIYSLFTAKFLKYLSSGDATRGGCGQRESRISVQTQCGNQLSSYIFIVRSYRIYRIVYFVLVLLFCIFTGFIHFLANETMFY